MPPKEAALIIRPSSVQTHRSQSSSWSPPEADEIGDYAARMIAKVLRPRHPSAAGKEGFELPLKRAFNHLDWIHRGWLSRAEVEQQCLAGLTMVLWKFGSSALARIVRWEDEKESSPDHRIDLQEFINIVLTVREELLNATDIKSSKKGLRIASSALRDRWASSESKKIFPRHWSRQFRYKSDREDAWGYPKYRRFMTYTHEFSGDIPLSRFPLTSNFASAVYLATRYCISKINAVFARWRAGLKQFAAKDRDEVVDALNNTFEAAAKFHVLESTEDLDTFHWLDHLLENAMMVPLPLFEDMKDCPLESVRSMGETCWLLLDYILGFIYELQIALGGTSTDYPDIQVWRRLRMLDRSRNISAMASVFRDIPSTLEEVKAWDSQHQSLEIYSKDCERYAKLLRQEQEKEIEQPESFKFRFSHVKIGKISHPPFRKALLSPHGHVFSDSSEGTPSTFFKIMVDGSYSLESSTETKTSTPVWTFYLYQTL